MLSHSKPNLYGAFIRSYAPLGTDVLKLCHAPEHAVFSYEQFFRAAFFSHSSFRKNDDLIRGFHRTHAVSDDQYEGDKITYFDYTFDYTFGQRV